jgi:hypothetical protein
MTRKKYPNIAASPIPKKFLGLEWLSRGVGYQKFIY